jgi:uncharacterized protein YbjQ (UPF0145 family)
MTDHRVTHAGKRLPRVIALVLIAGAAGVLAACNIVAPIAMIIEGPPTIDPAFTLDKDRPTLILVDDSLNILPRPQLREMMSKRAQGDLLKERVLTKVIDSKGAYAVISRDREGHTTSLIEVARAVKADVIVGVTIDTFGAISQGNEMVLECAFRVRVLDATKETQPRVWPSASIPEGAAFIARYRLPVSGKLDTNAEIVAAQNAIADQTGRAIAQVFYKHERSQAAAVGK